MAALEEIFRRGVDQWMPRSPDPTAATERASNSLRLEFNERFEEAKRSADLRIQSTERLIANVERRLDEHYTLLSKDITDGVYARKEALDAASINVRTALDKAEKALQDSLGDAKNDLERGLTAAEKRIDERFNNFKRSSDEIQAGIGKLYDEKFTSVQTQFQERETRTDQFRTADKIAIDAAFLAQKAAADKAELTTKETIEGLQALFQSSIEPLRNQIAALTGRVDRGEGSSRGPTDTERMISDLRLAVTGISEKSSGAADNTGRWMGAIALGITLIGFLYLLAAGHPLVLGSSAPVSPSAIMGAPIQQK